MIKLFYITTSLGYYLVQGFTYKYMGVFVYFVNDKTFYSVTHLVSGYRILVTSDRTLALQAMRSLEELDVNYPISKIPPQVIEQMLQIKQDLQIPALPDDCEFLPDRDKIIERAFFAKLPSSAMVCSS